jgi:hypothetical protein
MKFNEVQEIVEEGYKLRKAIAAAMLGASLGASLVGTHDHVTPINTNKETTPVVRTRGPCKADRNIGAYHDSVDNHVDLKDTVMPKVDLNDFPFDLESFKKHKSPEEKESKSGPGLGANHSKSDKEDVEKMANSLKQSLGNIRSK